MIRKQIALLLALMVALCACGGTPSESSAPEAEPSSSQEEVAPVVYPPEPTKLAWWTDYIYDACYSMQSDYPTRIQYDTAMMLEYTALRAHRDGALTLLGKAAENGNDIVAKDTLKEYTKRYFNVELDDLDIFQKETEDGKGLAFYVPIGGYASGENPADDTFTNGSFVMNDVRDLGDHRYEIEVGMENPDDSPKTYFTMEPHTDGSGYYIAQIRQDWGERDPAVQFGGTFLEAEKLLDMDGRHGSGHLYGKGEIGGKVLFCQGLDSGWLLMSLVSTEDLSEEFYEFGLEKGESLVQAQADARRIVVQTTRRVFTMGPDFSDYAEIAIPQALTDALGEFGLERILSFSDNMKLVAFTTDYGLEVFDFETGNVSKIAPHPNYNPDAQGKEMMATSTYGTPRFESGDTVLSATIYGYESTGNLVLFDLETGSKTEYEAGGGWESSTILAGDKVLAMTVSDGVNPVQYTWTDLAKEQQGTLGIPAGARQVLIQKAENDRVFALIDESKTGGGIYGTCRLYELNMETMTFEPKDFTVDGTDPMVLAVTENGKILLNWFSFNGGTGGYVLGG